MDVFEPVAAIGSSSVLLAGGLVVVALPLGWAVWTFNRLVRGRNRLREGWSGIEVQLKRRWELVPNLVRCVEAYRKHERETLEAVTRHRAAASAARGVREASGAETALGRDLGNLLMLAEAYPQLKADANFRDLAKTLVEIEDDLQFARRYYNGCVREQNNLVEGFPSMLVARLAAFSAGDYFEVENASERAAPALRSVIE